MKKLLLALAFILALGALAAQAQSMTPIYSFTNGPANPQAALAQGPDGNFYGTTVSGGSSGYGTVFQLTTNGTLTTLVNFNNVNGANPYAGLTLGTDGNFYGTTSSGGSGGDGTVFQMTTNGTLTTLVNFTNANGAGPQAGLTLSNDGNFYGTTPSGGSGNYGTVFKVTTNGTLTTLASFTSANGANPWAALTLGSDGDFYGTAYSGGSSGYGTVFQVTTNGTLTTLANFTGANGADPQAGLTLGSDGNFYGTTSSGGSGGGGNIYRLNLGNIIQLPLFTSQPQDQTVSIGCPAGFTPSVTGFVPLAYQWYFNGSLLPNATNVSLRFSPSLTNEIGIYQLFITNLYGSATSRLASLNVTFQPNSYAVSNSGGGRRTILLGS